MVTTLESRATALFLRFYHSISELTRKDGLRLCYWCERPETQRAMVNIWGTVYDVGACDECHNGNHGKARDQL